ncbi:unnamed protein product [Acanthoscelides obtectus]|uniref:Uncharacterized protein n=1 Tax=Acanthoscelides obtectus TaxID=200917 RepID=A0A9P0JJV6_ACAOB|nr:unnamed protein product [Acanthoscelides obtectus]CAK1678815.1 hypothetical protein AOBTE_LOCUS32030 [Acanthoscelides obtectus]
MNYSAFFVVFVIGAAVAEPIEWRQIGEKVKNTAKKVVPYVRSTCGRINQAIDTFYGAPMPYYPQYNTNNNPVATNAGPGQDVPDSRTIAGNPYNNNLNPYNKDYNPNLAGSPYNTNYNPYNMQPNSIPESGGNFYNTNFNPYNMQPSTERTTSVPALEDNPENNIEGISLGAGSEFEDDSRITFDSDVMRRRTSTEQPSVNDVDKDGMYSDLMKIFKKYNIDIRRMADKTKTD